MRVKVRTPDSTSKLKMPFSLTPGETYVVIGIEADDYRILGDTGEPPLYPAELFEVVDSREPSDWVSNYGEDGERYAYLPELGAPGFFEDYFDDVPEAVQTFEEFLRERTSDGFGPEAVTRMHANDLAEHLIWLPRQYRHLRTVSMCNLVNKTGYFAVHAQVSVDAIREALARHPECIDDWLRHSEDKRTSGWYFMKQGEQSYVVGCVGIPDQNMESTSVDAIEACAEFIKREVESIRCIA